jgi:hypothetical protein
MRLHQREGRASFGVGRRGPRVRDRLRVVLPSIVLVAGVAAACSSSGGIDAKSTVPLITPKAVVDPEPTDTPAPTKKPLSVAQVSLTESVRAGDEATIVIDTATAAECVIDVIYDSGPSEASGLKDRTADGAGTVTWSWIVERNTAAGTYPIEITCFKGERIGSLAVSFNVR